MSSPYYADESVTLYHGDCLDVLSSLADKSIDCVITDPPYSERTHKNAKTNKGKGYGVKAVHFASIDLDSLAIAMAECGRVSKRWIVATMDYHHAFTYEDTPPRKPKTLAYRNMDKEQPHASN